MVVAAVLAAAVGAAVATAAGPKAPTAVGATAVGDGVQLRFDTKVAGTPPVTAFLVTVDGVALQPSAVATAGRVVRLTLATRAYADDTVRVRYLPARAGARALRAATGTARVAGFVLDASGGGPAGCADPLGRVSPGTAGEGPTDTSAFLPSTGRLGIGYVPVDFSDTRDGVPSGIRTVPTVGGVPAQLPATFAALSYGKLAIDLLPSSGMSRMSKVMAAYDLGVTPSFAAARPFLQEALDIASNGTDFSRADIVFVEVNANSATPVPSGPTGRDWYRLIAPPGQGIVADGREIRGFVFLRGGFVRFPPSGFARQVLGLLGLPDLSQRQDQIGLWDAMSAADDSPSLLAWHRRKLGWLDPSQVQCVRRGTREVTLTPVSRSGGLKLVLAPVSPTAAVAVELVRREGLDALRCRDGVLVTRLDTDVPLRDPLVTPPIRVVPNRPPSQPPTTPGSPSCGMVFDQVLDATVGSVSSDGVTVRLVESRPDGTAVVRIERP